MNGSASMNVRVASFAALAPGSVTRVTHGDVAVAIVRIERDLYAIEDLCSHADVALSEGTVWEDECEIECWKHGTTFSLKTGEPQSLPATQPVRIFAVSVSGDDVLVDFGPEQQGAVQ
jgi:3-phenylpropionate/trans-cinnamate dioxygenase ferredoxin component